MPADTPAFTPEGVRIVIDGTGEWYERICYLPGGVEVSREAVYLHPRAADPVELREDARERVPFPALTLHLSPGGDQVVNFATWLWVEPRQWQPVSATASVPGLSVTVVAVPQRVTWSMGDGSRVVCNGPGTPYDSSRPEAAQHTDCSHVYRESSAGQPGDAYQLAATIEWGVTWSAAGAAGGGDLGVISRTTPPVPVRVAEVQSLATRTGAR